MDRLHTLSLSSVSTTTILPPVAALGLVAACGLAVAGCEGKAEETTTSPPPARFQAAMAKDKPDKKELEAFCDVQGGPKLELPALVGEAPADPGWVNVWATWCKACVEEMPMIERWKSKLGTEILYISTDEEAEVLDAYMKEHPNIPRSTRMEDSEALPEFLKKWGVDPGAGLPLHIFVGADKAIKCVRAGAVAEHHYDIVAMLMEK